MTQSTPQLTGVTETPNRGDNVIDNTTTPRHQADTETAWQPAKPPKPLTRKQQAFVQELINNPKQSAAAAARKTYNTHTSRGARAIATENLAKPSILNELAKHSATAELTILEVLQESKNRMYDDKPRAVDWANTARQTADSLLDRVHGKATQKTESVSTTVTLSLSLKDITSDSTDPTGVTTPNK